jgi:hypothetical protein
MTPGWLNSERIIVLAIPLAAFAVVVVVDALEKRAAGRMKDIALASQPAPKWAVALLVDADETSSTLRPMVQLLGPQLPSDITVYLRVGDKRGGVCLITERRFLDPETKTDLLLAMIVVPDGVSVAKVAFCDWTVVVSHGGHEMARRCGPLAAAPHLNEEGELQAPDLESVPDETKPPPATPSPVRSRRWTTGLSCAVSSIAIGGYLLTTLSAWLWLAAVPLFVLAGILLVAAALVLCTSCPICGRATTVIGRTGAQRCDACGGAFTLTLT